MALCIALVCVFSSSSDGWSDEGCHEVVSKRSLEETVCSCNRLTHFAVLFDFRNTMERVMLVCFLLILSYVTNPVHHLRANGWFGSKFRCPDLH